MAKKKSKSISKMKRRDIKKPSSTNYSKLIISVLVVFLLGTLLWKYASPTPTPIGINEIANVSTGIIDLSLSPATLSIAPGAEQSIDLKIVAGTTKVTAAEIILAYDPAIIGTPTVTQGSFLSNTLSSPKVEGGKITFTYAAAPDDGGKSGSGTLATIKIKPVSVGDATIAFAEGTAAVAVDHTDNVIKSANGTQVKVSTTTSLGAINAVTQEKTTTPSQPAATTAPAAKTAVTTAPAKTTSPKVAVATKAPTVANVPSKVSTTPANPAVTYVPPTNSLTDDTSADIPVADYPYTQAELDKKFDSSNNLSIWQKIVNFFINIFGAKTK